MQTTPLETDFEAIIEDWRQRRGLKDDDPVFLCVELFRLHQDQWDAIRQRDLPSLRELRADIASLSSVASWANDKYSSPGEI